LAEFKGKRKFRRKDKSTEGDPRKERRGAMFDDGAADCGFGTAGVVPCDIMEGIPAMRFRVLVLMAAMTWCFQLPA
jgi:hypothetical protein